MFRVPLRNRCIEPGNLKRSTSPRCTPPPGLSSARVGDGTVTPTMRPCCLWVAEHGGPRSPFAVTLLFCWGTFKGLDNRSACAALAHPTNLLLLPNRLDFALHVLQGLCPIHVVRPGKELWPIGFGRYVGVIEHPVSKGDLVRKECRGYKTGFWVAGVEVRGTSTKPPGWSILGARGARPQPPPFERLGFNSVNDPNSHLPTR